MVILLETFNLPEGSARFEKVFLNTCQKTNLTMKLSKVHVIITSGLTQISVVFCFEKKYISEFCLRVYTSTVNSRGLAYAPFQHLWHNLASRAQSLTDMSSRWNPPSPYLLTFWHFTLWQEKRFFRKWMGYNRCIQAHPFFLLLVFRWFAISLLAHYFRSSALIKSPTQANSETWDQAQFSFAL